MKPLAELTQGDSRQKHFGGPNALHDALSTIILESSVPSQVQELFDTALNLALYSWFVYDFHPIAELTGFIALEAALKERARRENQDSAKERSLNKLVRIALAEGWIAEGRIAGRREIARARVEQRKAMEAIKRASEIGADSISIDEASEEEIFKEAEEMRIIESTCRAAIRLRNALAHGERYLDPGSPRRLRITADLINQLYS